MSRRSTTAARLIRGAFLALAVVAYLVPSLVGAVGGSLCLAADGGVRVGCCGIDHEASADATCCCDDTADAAAAEPAADRHGCCGAAGAHEPATGREDAPDSHGKGRCLKVAPLDEPSSAPASRTPDLPSAADLGVVGTIAALDPPAITGGVLALRPDARAGPPPGSACPRGFVLRI